MVCEEGIDTKDTWAEGKNLLAVFEGLPSSMLAMIFYRYLTIG